MQSSKCSEGKKTTTINYLHFHDHNLSGTDVITLKSSEPEEEGVLRIVAAQ